VGFTVEQAEIFANEQARLIEDKLATKNDLVEMKINLNENQFRSIVIGGNLYVLWRFVEMYNLS